MATSPRYGLADRHVEILDRLSWGAFSTRQLLKLSRTWPEPFVSDRQLRRHLQRLAAAKLIVARPFATLSAGNAENYYQLTSAGFRLLHGAGATLPSQSYFAPLSLSRQAHHRAVMDFVVHTAVTAFQSGIELRELYPENTLVVSTGLESLRPDAAFTLLADGQTYRYFVEIDNATATLAASRSRDSIGQKLRVYETVQDESLERFRVLVLSVRPTRQRLANIRRLAAELTHNPDRTLCLTCSLDDYLTSTHPGNSVWLDHRERSQSLLPIDNNGRAHFTTPSLTLAGAVV